VPLYCHGNGAMKFCDLITGPLLVSGHDLEYHQSIDRALTQMGLVTERIHINRKKGWRLFDFINHFCKNDCPRIFFLETIPFLDLIALTLASLFLKKQDQLILLFRHEMKRKLGYLLLAILRKKRVVFCSDSQRLAQKIGAKVLPILHTDRMNGYVKAPPDSLILWWPGPPREEKGMSIIKSLAMKLRGAKLYAHLHAEGISYLPELKRADYVEQMIRSHIILLPYDPVAYYARTSGILVEAICAGKIPFVLEGSWLANELREHNLEELIIDFTSFEEIVRLAKDRKVLEKLEKMQSYYREYHSLENFKKMLAQLILSVPSMVTNGSQIGHQI